jgi:hypothetical protein
MGKYDDDEDEVTTTSTKYRDSDATDTDGVPASAGRVIKRGWGAVEETKATDSPFAQRLKITTDKVIIKFLEDDPYTSFRQHWIERQGQKSFTCTSNIHAKGCPLCDAGDRPSARFCFNVALLIEGEEPFLRSYEVGPRVVDSLKNFHQDPKMGPLPKNYWAVSKTGKGATSQTNHQMVKAGDLAEDWSLDPITETQLAALKKKAYDSSIVSIPPFKTLQQIAAEELGGD